MPLTIPTFLRQPNISAIARTADVPTQFVRSNWFPDDGVDSDEFESLLQTDIVELAPFVNIDAESPTASPVAFAPAKWEVAYMRFKTSFKESDLRIFDDPGAAIAGTESNRIALGRERKMRADIDRLSVAIDARKEWVFANALAGQVAVTTGPVKFTVSYTGAHNGTNKKTPSTLWTAASPTIVNDLATWVEAVMETDSTGSESWTLLTTSKVLALMARDSGIQRLWQNASGIPAPQDPGAIAPSMVSGALSMLGISNVMRYNAKYTVLTPSEGGLARTLTRFISDYDMFLLPSGVNLGRYAMAPAAQNNYAPGRFGWTEEKVDPWVLNAGVGEYSWIDFPGQMWNSVLQATVG